MLTEIIDNLIKTKKEGEYWDFKEMHHHKGQKGSLIKDIIAFANNPNYVGDRYLIYGVFDKTFEVKGLCQKEFRRTQSEIIDLLRNAGFAKNFPDITVHKVSIENKDLDVLVIRDKPSERPYYLQKGPYQEELGTAIYSRRGDTNGLATDLDIETMWRQKFGLDDPPIHRIKNYLLDVDGWEKTPGLENDVYHYKNFPEFIVVVGELLEKEFHEDWLKSFPDKEHNFPVYVDVKYHATILERMTFISCDGTRYLAPIPERKIYRPEDDALDNFDYFYVRSSLNYLVFCMFQKFNHFDSESFFSHSRIRLVQA